LKETKDPEIRKTFKANKGREMLKAIDNLSKADPLRKALIYSNDKGLNDYLNKIRKEEDPNFK